MGSNLSHAKQRTVAGVREDSSGEDGRLRKNLFFRIEEMTSGDLEKSVDSCENRPEQILIPGLESVFHSPISRMISTPILLFGKNDLPNSA